MGSTCRDPSWVVASKSWKTFRTSLKVLKVCQKKKWRESLERKFWMVNWEGKWTSLWKYGSDWKIHLGCWVALPNILNGNFYLRERSEQSQVFNDYALPISKEMPTDEEKRWLDNWLTFDTLLLLLAAFALWSTCQGNNAYSNALRKKCMK